MVYGAVLSRTALLPDCGLRPLDQEGAKSYEMVVYLQKQSLKYLRYSQ